MIFTISRSSKLILMVILGLLLFSNCNLAAGTLNLDDAISIFMEKDSTLTLEEVVVQKQPEFKKIDNHQLYLGTSNQAYWIKIDIKAKHAEKREGWILELNTFKLNRIDLFYLNEDGKWLQQEDGVKLSGLNREKSKRHFSFFLPEKSIDSPIFLRLDAYYYRVPIHLWSVEEYQKKEQNQILSDGFFYGIVLAIISYHFLIFLAIRVRSYLIYAFFLTSVVLTYFSGQGWIFAYLFSHYPIPVSNLTYLTGPFTGWLLILLGVQFTGDYLNLSQYAVILNKTLKGLQIAIVSFGLVTAFSLVSQSPFIFGILYNFGFLLTIVAILLCFYAAIQGFHHHQPSARFYLSATSLQFVVSTLMILAVYQIIPIAFDWKILQWSTIIEMAIFSYGLSRQVKQIETDKQRFNQELLTTKEQMIEQLEIINNLKDKVLSNIMESRLYPEFAKIFSVMKDIIYIQAIGNYSKIIYLNEGIEDEIEILASLKDIEKCFDETIFIRIHKTYLIKQGYKLSLQRRSSADYDLVSQHFVLPVGRKFIPDVRKHISTENSKDSDRLMTGKEVKLDLYHG